MANICDGAVKKMYFDYLKETSGVCSSAILSYFENFGKRDPKFKAIFMPILERRLKHSQLRAVITRLSYELAGGEDWKKVVPLCAAMELQTMYLYLHNWIFDNKKALWDGRLGEIRRKVEDVVISAAVMRELIPSAISDADAPIEVKTLIEKEFSKSTVDVYYGQHLDINLTIEKLDGFKSDEEFLRSYEYKSGLLTGNAYGLSAYIGAIIGGANSDQMRAIRRISELFGTGVHVSNDLGDFAPPEQQETTFGKAYQDQLADIREGRLTLPVYYVLRYGTRAERETLLNLVNNHNPNMNQITDGCRAIHTSGSYVYCRKYIRRFFKDAKRELHKAFGKSHKRDMYSTMLSVIRTNKFLVGLRKLNEPGERVERIAPR